MQAYSESQRKINYPNPREPKITYACMAQNANEGKIDQTKGKT